MLRLLLILIVAAVGWYGWGKYQARVGAAPPAEVVLKPLKRLLPAGAAKTPAAAEPPLTFFTCDARTSCAQMNSCEEVRFFAKNCPGFAWEASGESPSCVTQWCK